MYDFNRLTIFHSIGVLLFLLLIEGILPLCRYLRELKTYGRSISTENFILFASQLTHFALLNVCADSHQNVPVALDFLIVAGGGGGGSGENNLKGGGGGGGVYTNLQSDFSSKSGTDGNGFPGTS